jgi:predicted nucleic-acid-binding protein
MIALDTNILVRYLTQDDPAQARAATRFIESELSARRPGFVSSIVLCEIIWVLEECYHVERAELSGIVEGLLSSRELLVEHAAAARAALAHAGADLSDAIIHEIGRARRCETTVTFDKKFARLDGVELLPQ